MIGSIGAQIALLAFAVAIVAGLYVGNSFATVLTRALVAMIVGLAVGKLTGWTSKLVLRDHLMRRKLAIDKAHITRAAPAESEDAPEQSHPAETG